MYYGKSFFPCLKGEGIIFIPSLTVTNNGEMPVHIQHLGRFTAAAC